VPRGGSVPRAAETRLNRLSASYTKPWTIKVTQILPPDTELLDYICLENERDVQHLPKEIK
jgi:hypothetical protein